MRPNGVNVIVSVPKSWIWTASVLCTAFMEVIAWTRLETFLSILWVVMNVLLLFLSVTIAFSHASVIDHTLTVDNFTSKESVNLDELAYVSAERKGKGNGWVIVLTDKGGARANLKLNGIRAVDRRLLLEALTRFIERDQVDKRGPLAQVMRENSWFPREGRRS